MRWVVVCFLRIICVPFNESYLPCCTFRFPGSFPTSFTQMLTAEQMLRGWARKMCNAYWETLWYSKCHPGIPVKCLRAWLRCLELHNHLQTDPLPQIQHLCDICRISTPTCIPVNTKMQYNRQTKPGILFTPDILWYLKLQGPLVFWFFIYRTVSSVLCICINTNLWCLTKKYFIFF